MSIHDRRGLPGKVKVGTIVVTSKRSINMVLRPILSVYFFSMLNPTTVVTSPSETPAHFHHLCFRVLGFLPYASVDWAFMNLHQFFPLYPWLKIESIDVTPKKIGRGRF